MNKNLLTIVCLLTTIALHLPVQAKTTGYNEGCRSSSKWKQAKSHQFSTQGKSYTLIESHKPDPKDLKFSYVSFCLVQGNSVKSLKIFQNNSSVPLSATGNIYNFKKVSDSVFTMEFAYDTDVSNIMLYKIDVRSPKNPKVTLLRTSYG